MGNSSSSPAKAAIPSARPPSSTRPWHLHLVHTEDYWGDFCPNLLKIPLHHSPATGTHSEAAMFADWSGKTLASYRKFFGPPPPLWLNSPRQQRPPSACDPDRNRLRLARSDRHRRRPRRRRSDRPLRRPFHALGRYGVHHRQPRLSHRGAKRRLQLRRFILRQWLQWRLRRGWPRRS